MLKLCDTATVNNATLDGEHLIPIIHHTILKIENQFPITLTLAYSILHPAVYVTDQEDPSNERAESAARNEN